jgi:excisionase family DNA binding protein
MNQPAERQVMTPHEAARYLRISNQKIYGLLKERKVIGRNVGTEQNPRWRILRSELDRYLTTPEDVSAPPVSQTLRNRPTPRQYV